MPRLEEGPSRSEEKLVRSLHRRKGREDSGLFLAEGRRVVEDLLASPLDLRLGLVVSTFGDTQGEAELLARLESRCPVRRVPPALLAELADTDSPQGVLVVGRAPAAALEAQAVKGPAVVLVLDGVQDPGNLGTLARTSEALGVAFLVTLPGTVDPWNPKAVRSAAGSLFRIPVVEATPPALMEWLADRGFALYTADLGGAPPDTSALPQRVALAVGNEGAGLSAEIAAAAEGVLTIPLSGGAESLNVAVAAGILLYLLTSRAPAPPVPGR